MSAWRTPERTVAADCPDQISDLDGDCGPADTDDATSTASTSGRCCDASAAALGLEDYCGFQEGRAQPVEAGEDQPISSTGADRFGARSCLLTNMISASRAA
jgi:hypothetical protein